MAARKNTQALRDDWRLKIKTSMLLNRLMDHIEGKCELSATQVRSAEILLKKTLPDLSQISGILEHTGTVEHKVTESINFAGIQQKAIDVSARKTH